MIKGAFLGLLVGILLASAIAYFTNPSPAWIDLLEFVCGYYCTFAGMEYGDKYL